VQVRRRRRGRGRCGARGGWAPCPSMTPWPPCPSAPLPTPRHHSPLPALAPAHAGAAQGAGLRPRRRPRSHRLRPAAPVRAVRRRDGQYGRDGGRRAQHPLGAGPARAVRQVAGPGPDSARQGRAPALAPALAPAPPPLCGAAAAAAPLLSPALFFTPPHVLLWPWPAAAPIRPKRAGGTGNARARGQRLRPPLAKAWAARSGVQQPPPPTSASGQRHDAAASRRGAARRALPSLRRCAFPEPAARGRPGQAARPTSTFGRSLPSAPAPAALRPSAPPPPPHPAPPYLIGHRNVHGAWHCTFGAQPAPLALAGGAFVCLTCIICMGGVGKPGRSNCRVC
jgi:hypothetical protein